MTWRRFSLVAGAAAAWYHVLVASRIDLITYADGVLRITDVAYYLIIVRAFWLEGPRSIYSAADNLAIMHRLVSADLGAAMPLGLTPIAVFVYAPFALLSKLSMAFAQSAWVGVSAASVAMMLAGLQQDRARLSPRDRLRWWLAVGSVLVSFASLTTLLLGQTSLAALAALGLIIQAGRAPGAVSWPITGLALLLVGLKPTYLMFGLFVIFAYRRWRLLAAGVALTVAGSAGFTLLSGSGWWWDYWRMVGMFAATAVAPEFRSAFAFEKMNIFRSAWAAWAPEAQVLRVSTIIALTGAAVAGLGLVRDLRSGEPRGSARTLSRCSLIVGVYLLFAPYASTYEDLLLLVPVLFLLVSRPDRLSDWRMLPLLGALGLVCNALPLMSPSTRELLWCLKAVACGLSFVLLTGSSPPPTTSSGGRGDRMAC